jgi:hypothetical protein
MMEVLPSWLINGSEGTIRAIGQSGVADACVCSFAVLLGGAALVSERLSKV